MRWRSLIWFIPGLLLLACFWRYGHCIDMGFAGGQTLQPPGNLGPPPSRSIASSLPVSGVLNHGAPTRLSNTRQSLATVVKSDRAILLENSILDTEAGQELPIPADLRCSGDPGAYIVQCRGGLDWNFRNCIAQAGGIIVSYIPNNAYLVRAGAVTARQLAMDERVHAVVPYEPYFKLKPSLLAVVSGEQTPGAPAPVDAQSLAKSPGEIQLNLLLFEGGSEEVRGTLGRQSVKIQGESSSPFGPVFTVSCNVDAVARFAQLTGVQALELSRRPVPAMDLGRVASRISSDSTAPTNYLGLSGAGAAVAVLDTGIDAGHPDLAGRVVFDEPPAGTDIDGHGTHVASVVGGNGSSSPTVANAPGSSAPAVMGQFRGSAPGSILHSILIYSTNGPVPLQACLEQAARGTNTASVNASWNYWGDNEYDFAAATCDAAVRDALPAVSGAQPLLCVVSAGNGGAGSAEGTGGIADSIYSPGTAKNVITVGALEKRRGVTNETSTCTPTDGCQTNQPWFASTDSSTQVAMFSGRGNVGIGTEGEVGRIKPDLVAQGSFVVAARAREWNKAAYYAGSSNLFTASPDTNYAVVFSNLNESIGPFYRFESGTSLAAAQVSGALALMNEFFARLGRTNSPALMKALLINGARGVPGYGLGSGAAINFQGWGQLNLPATIPPSLTNAAGGTRSMFAFDQDSSRPLATGENQTRRIDVKSAARSLPLRMTLVWTDPPGNPAAALKLVNDLDLVVTNLDSGQVYFGNDIPAGSQFSQAWDAASSPERDAINNVEAVILPPPLAGRYSVTVSARRVGVNAVSSSITNIVQDYALVISSGDGEVAAALDLEGQAAGVEFGSNVVVLANQFDTASGLVGAVQWRERVGAGSPLLSNNNIPLGPNGTAALAPGTTNQWRFYVLENSSSFTNAAFATFLPTPLAPGVIGGSVNYSVQEADIDLYVSSDPALLDLAPAAISSAAKSLARGGAESIVLSNALPGFYYIGVKCESQQAAEYNLMAIVSELPFHELDLQGRSLLRGIPAPALIPGPGIAAILGLAPDPFTVRRVVMTNNTLHSAVPELRGILTHGAVQVVVNNHSTNTGPDFVYDQSGEGDLPKARACDGPGSLADFGGTQGAGQWLLTMESTNHSGTNQSLWISLEPQVDLFKGVNASVLPGGCRRDFVSLPLSAVSLVGMVSVTSGSGPVSFQLHPVEVRAEDSVTVLVPGGANGVLAVDSTTSPPIRAGTYVSRLCNLGPDPVEVALVCNATLDPQPPPTQEWVVRGPLPLPDDAALLSGVAVTNQGIVQAAEVGVRINHPRISDLTLTLLSPGGRRVLLQENRGGSSREGMGTDTVKTNVTMISYTGGPEAFTNEVQMEQTSGVAWIDYDFYSLPDTMHVYYEGTLLFDSGLVGGKGSTEIRYGPGTASSLTIVMNEGGNSDTNTAWFYKVTSTLTAPLPITFTENPNFTVVPIKFAPLPLTNINYSPPGSSGRGGIFYLPEQSLGSLTGESAFGEWRLEICDTRVGPLDAAPQLVSWQLNLALRPELPVPVSVTPGQSLSRLLAPRQVLWLAVDAPQWVNLATNSLLSASSPVNLLFSYGPPGAGSPAPVPLLLASTGGSALLQTNVVPRLVPGSRYYLGVQNLSGSTATFALQVDFDVNTVVTLESGVPFLAVSYDPATSTQFYRFVVNTNAVRGQFEVRAPTGNVALFVRKGLPLPGPALADYSSDNFWTNDEMIIVYDYSAPVALSPGEWYLAVVNPGTTRSDYSVLATEFMAYGTNLVITDHVITDSTLCITWTSLAGARYFVQGKVSIDDPAWVTISPTITAFGSMASYCVQLTSPFQFFRICEGIVVAEPPLTITSVSLSPTGVLLEWLARPGGLYKVEWSPTLDPPAWSTFADIVSSGDGRFRFLDIASQPGNTGAARFYRLVKVP